MPIAWSPDGKMVAVLGYSASAGGNRANCPSSSLNYFVYMPGQIDIYSAASGDLIAKIQPDVAIDQALHLAPPVGATPAARNGDVSHQVIQYLDILWSPDGKQIAASFVVEPTGAAPYTEGVLLANPDGTQTRVLFHTPSTTTPSYGEWDIAAGRYIPIPGVAGSQDGQPVPPALSYTWGADDRLMPQGPTLSPSSALAAPAPGPIGNPDGGTSFTIWQPTSFAPDSNGANLYGFGAGFAAWSPDGSRLIPRVGVGGVISTDPSQPPSAGHPRDKAVIFPLRDKGLANGLADVRGSRPGSDTDAIPVMWRPDGKVVAVVTEPVITPDNPNPAAPFVRFYDCASGRLLGTVREQIPSTNPDPYPAVSWSPDGTHLLMLDSANMEVTIWGSGQLPSA